MIERYTYAYKHIEVLKGNWVEVNPKNGKTVSHELGRVMLLLQDSFRGADFLGVFRMAKGVGIAEGCACIRIS